MCQACWNEIVYCSATCRKPLSALDHAFESRLLSMLTERRFDAVHGLKKGGASLAEVSLPYTPPSRADAIAGQLCEYRRPETWLRFLTMVPCAGRRRGQRTSDVEPRR